MERAPSLRLTAAGLLAGLIVTSAVVTGLLAAVPAGQAPVPSTAPVIDPVQRFLGHPDEKLTQYRAKRHLKARNERFNKEAWLDALTELDPGKGFRYTILAEDGSGLIRNRVLHRALEAEQQALASGDVGRSAISPANYQINFGEHEGTTGLDRLRIIPLRKEQMLVDGTISVLAADGDLVRIEGRLAKTPSFWTNRVDIIRRYGRIEGVHVPLSIESTANLKIVGDSVFSMTYTYESVNGKAVTGPGQQPVQ